MDASQIINFNKEFIDLSHFSQEINLEHEKKKLILMHGIYDNMIEKLNFVNLKNLDLKDDNPFLSSKDMFYYSLIITSVLKHALSSFLFGVNLLELIPKLSHPQVILISLIFTLLDSIIFYAIEVIYLNRALNITGHLNNYSALLETYILQLQLINAINQELASGNAAIFKKNEYQAYLDCIFMLNQDITDKFLKIKDCQDSIITCIIKNMIIFIGVVSKFAGSYFIAKSLLNTFAPYLICTPIGYVFIATIMFGGVGTFYVLGNHSVTKLMNHQIDILNQLKENFKIFENDMPKYQSAYRLNQKNFFHSFDEHHSEPEYIFAS